VKNKQIESHSVVDLDGLLHVVVAGPLGVLVDVLQPDVRLGARLTGVGVLQVGAREVSDPNVLDVFLVEVPSATVEDEREPILFKLFVGDILKDSGRSVDINIFVYFTAYIEST